MTADFFVDSQYDSILGGTGWGDDMILQWVLSFDDSKVQRRAVSSCWRQLIEARFPHRKYDPPEGGVGVLEFEKDLQMNKLIYSVTLQFGRNGSPCSESSKAELQQQQEKEQPPLDSLKLEHSNSTGTSSSVAFMNWVPSYYRSNLNDDRDQVVHEIEETDAIAVWILITKLLHQGIAQGDKGQIMADAATEGGPGLETCIACSGSGCRLCGGRGIRRMPPAPPPSVHFESPGGPTAFEARRPYGFLRVRCGSGSSDDSPSEGGNEHEPMNTLAEKRPLSSLEVTEIGALLDHRNNARLMRRKCPRAPIVPFGGVRNF
jgi:hypothetical protein